MNFPEEIRERHISQTKLKRIATVEVCTMLLSFKQSADKLKDVAEQVLCLAKLRSVTGQNVVLDGGYTL